MLISGQGHVVQPGDGRIVELGVTRMRVLAAGQDVTRGSFTLAEFTGSKGPWTVPHLHRGMEESFFVLDGEFTLTVGDQEVTAGPDGFVMVPRNTPHVFAATTDQARCLVLMVPGGLEEMFYELGGLGADSIRDPAVRAAISARYDSVPVQMG
jgi:quercetin dioxygenase-like cupin family protein